MPKRNIISDKNCITPDLEFFGMYKNRKDWKGRSSVAIAEELRRSAWCGGKSDFSKIPITEKI